LYNELIETATNYANKLKELKELESKGLEDISQNYDKIVDNLDSLNTMLDHQLTLTKLLYGEKSYNQ